MGRNRKLTLTSGPSGKGLVDFRPLSSDAHPLNGVRLQGPDSVGSSPLDLVLPPSVVDKGVLSTSSAGLISSALLVNNNIDAAAAIALSKLAALTANKVLISDNSGIITQSSVTNVELSYLSGVTSAIQTQIDSKSTKTLTNGSIFIGNASNIATEQVVSGDVLITNSGVTSYNNTLPINKGGTGQTSKSAAFDALSPMTTGGDLIYGGASGTGTRLANGSSGQVLTSNGTTTAPSWQSAPAPVSQTLIVGNTLNISPGANNIVMFANVYLDTNSAYDTSTGLFTSPSSGLYLVTLTVNTSIAADFWAKVNGTDLYNAVHFVSSGTNGIGSGSMMVALTAGDTLGIYIDTGALVGFANTLYCVTKIGN